MTVGKVNLKHTVLVKNPPTVSRNLRQIEKYLQTLNLGYPYPRVGHQTKYCWPTDHHAPAPKVPARCEWTHDSSAAESHRTVCAVLLRCFHSRPMWLLPHRTILVHWWATGTGQRRLCECLAAGYAGRWNSPIIEEIIQILILFPLVLGRLLIKRSDVALASWMVFNL